MGVSFVILLPFGAIIIRFLSAYLSAPTLHSINQFFALLCILAAMGLGIYLSQGMQFIYFRNEIRFPLI